MVRIVMDRLASAIASAPGSPRQSESGAATDTLAQVRHHIRNGNQLLQRKQLKFAMEHYDQAMAALADMAVAEGLDSSVQLVKADLALGLAKADIMRASRAGSTQPIQAGTSAAVQQALARRIKHLGLGHVAVAEARRLLAVSIILGLQSSPVLDSAQVGQAAAASKQAWLAATAYADKFGSAHPTARSSIELQSYCEALQAAHKRKSNSEAISLVCVLLAVAVYLWHDWPRWNSHVCGLSRAVSGLLDRWRPTQLA